MARLHIMPGFIAATSMKLAGYSTENLALEIVTTRSSIGSCRINWYATQGKPMDPNSWASPGE